MSSEMRTFLKLTPHFCIIGSLQFLTTACFQEPPQNSEKQTEHVCKDKAATAECISV